jgi:hypothetical protein
MLAKFKQGAQKAGIQATAFLKESQTKLSTETRDFAQGFTLPGEAEKAAKILESFLGKSNNLFSANLLSNWKHALADPSHPESALNSIPKAVLQRARGKRPPPPFSPH